MLLVRPAVMEDVPQIARVHVDSWRSTYSGILSEDFLAAMSYEDFKAHWRDWIGGEFGVPGISYVAELPAGGIVGFASGGPLQEEKQLPRVRRPALHRVPITPASASGAGSSSPQGGGEGITGRW